MSSVSAPLLSSKLTVFGAWLCPYVHRVWLALLEKNVDFQWVEIDLSNKPDWFLDVNPLGKVPVIGYKDDAGTHLINESMTLLEFLEDRKEGTPLLPEHPALRAQSRNLITSFHDRVGPAWYGLLRATDEQATKELAAKLTAALEQVEKQLSPTGPFFLGEEFSLVDAGVLPWLVRLPVLKHYRGYELPASLGRLRQYIDAALARETVQQTLKAPGGDYWEELNKAYVTYGGTPTSFL